MCGERTADCFRFAIPAEAIGNWRLAIGALERWRLRGLEDWGIGGLVGPCIGGLVSWWFAGLVDCENLIQN